jgi:hypothetical protein
VRDGQSYTSSRPTLEATPTRSGHIAVAETSRELHEAEVKILGLAFAAEVKTTDGVVATLNDLAATRS